jgi:hypothetical protein
MEQYLPVFAKSLSRYAGFVLSHRKKCPGFQICGSDIRECDADDCGAGGMGLNKLDSSSIF